MLLLRVVLSLTLASVAFGQHRLSIDDVITARRIVAVQIAPAGDQVAYSLEEPAATGTARAKITLWVVPVSGGSAHQLAKQFGSLSSPQWFPDGKHLGFLSEGKVFQVAADGGEPRLLLKHSESVGAWDLSPDGQKIVFVATDVSRKRVEDPIVLDPSEPLARRTPNHALIFDLASQSTHAVATDRVHVISAKWAPDNKRLLLVVADRPYPDWEQLRPRLMVAPSSGGAPQVWCETQGKISGPQWSPRGNAIGFLGSVEGDSDFFPNGLFVCEGQGGAPRNVTKDAHYTVESFRWAPDGNSLLVTAAQATRRYLARLESGGRLVDLTGDEQQVHFRSDWDVAPNGTIAFVASRDTVPPDVFVLDRALRARRLTDTNPGLRDRTYASARELRWKAADGLEISGVLLLPPEPKPPLIVHLHGSNMGEARDFHVSPMHWGQLLAANGYAVLMVNYRGSLTNGAAFARAFRGDLGGKDIDDIIGGAEAAARSGLVDPARTGVSGVSYGGYLTASTITHTQRFKAAVMLSGISNYWTIHTGVSAAPQSASDTEWGRPVYESRALLLDRSPSSHLERIRTPTLILWGEFDPAIPNSQAMELFRGLRHYKVPSELVIYPRDGHVIMEPSHQRDMFTRILGWFDRYLKK